MSDINPVKIYNQNIRLIDDIFLSIPGISHFKIPKIKICIIGGGNDVLDRLFVVEDGPDLISIIKNVLNSKNKYLRTLYMIVRSKVKYVHFSGKVFNSLIELAELETTLFNTEFKFICNGKTYNKVSDIEGRKDDIKLLAKDGKSYDIPSLYEYISSRSNLLQTLIGYYIPEESYINLHPVTYYNNKFGDYDIEFIRKYFDRIYEPGFIEFLINNQSSDTNSTNKRVKATSLITAVNKEKNEQSKRAIVGLYICEMLFGMFYFD